MKDPAVLSLVDGESRRCNSRRTQRTEQVWRDFHHVPLPVSSTYQAEDERSSIPRKPTPHNTLGRFTCFTRLTYREGKSLNASPARGICVGMEESPLPPLEVVASISWVVGFQVLSPVGGYGPALDGDCPPLQSTPDSSPRLAEDESLANPHHTTGLGEFPHVPLSVSFLQDRSH